MSKFLSGSGNVTVQDLTDGSLSINAAQLNASNLIPNFPVKADSNQKLYSTILNASDITGVLVTPYNGIIEATDFETQNYFSINNQLQYINNFEDSTLNNTNITGSVNITSQVVVPKITDTTQTVRIELDDTDVNVIGQNFTFNGLDVLTGTVPNLQDLEDKTFHIQLPLNPNATIFQNEIYSDKFVTNGGTNQQYIMGDGSTLQYSANSGNSNFYLYNNGTDQDPTPAIGLITYNTVIQDNATIIYISHRTRDTIDIEVFFKNLSTLNDVYIQDQENSDNNITYNITGSPVIVNQAQVTIPVIKRTSNGTGSSNFGINHNLLLSFFTNSIETDVRLSNLETKTQNIEATASKLTVNRSLELKINDTTDFLAIRSLDGLTNYLIMTDTNTDIYTDVNLNGNDITNIGSVIISGGSSTEFLKADGTLDDNDYLLPTDTVITDLQNKTQHITANISNTIFNKTIFHRLGVTDALRIVSSEVGESFIFDVSRTIINAYKQLHMNNQAVTNALGYATQGGLSTGFLKANGTIDSSAYITATNSVITNLQNKTQNISGSLIGTDITNNLNVILRVANGDFFTIRNDGTPVSVNKFNVSNTSVQISSIPLQMNNQKIQFLATPVDPSDATRKDYVDDLITPLQIATQNLIASAVVSTFIKDIRFKLNGPELFIVSNTDVSPITRFLVSNASVEAGVPIAAPAFIKAAGQSNQFLKADGSVDSNTYVTTATVAGKLNIDGSNAMTGALNMNSQAINNSGIISAVGFVKNGGLGSEFLKANGGSDARILNGLQVLQSNFQVGVNGVTTEVNLTASPDVGSYIWADNVTGITRRWKFYAISTRGNGNTIYTMRFKSSLGTMFEWVLPILPANLTNQHIEITMTVTRRLPTSLVFYGKWDCSSTGTTQGFWTAASTTTNVPGLFNGSDYDVTIQSNNANANITFQYIEVQNVYG